LISPVRKLTHEGVADVKLENTGKSARYESMSEQVVSKHKVVSFTFSITDETGKTVERSDMPFDYLHGAPNSHMFPKLEAALEGKKVGDTVDVTLQPEEAFGHHNPELTFADDIDNIPSEYRFVGARPVFHNDQGEAMQLVVTRIENGKITLDANHPYAGKVITFHVTVDGVRDARESELGAGVPDEQPSVH
jgi:FKBP-type peptidyl-prolyl cis-trans isomerase SlyD